MAQVCRVFMTFVALFLCAMVPGEAHDHSTVTSGCTPADNILAGLRLATTDPGAVEPVQQKVAVRPRWAVLISGRCAGDLVGARAGYFRLKSGASVELSRPVQDPNVGLRLSEARALVDTAEDVAVPAAIRHSSLGRLLSITSALDPNENVHRYTAVWSRPSSSLIGFLDFHRDTGRYTQIPLFKVPMQTQAAYYLPSPDTSSGDITILGPVNGGMKVITVSVDM